MTVGNWRLLRCEQRFLVVGGRMLKRCHAFSKTRENDERCAAAAAVSRQSTFTKDRPPVFETRAYVCVSGEHPS